MPRAAKTSGRNREEAPFPLPGKETRDLFLVALDMAEESIRSGLISVDIDPDGSLDFEYERRRISALPSENFRAGLSADHFLVLLETEFRSLLRSLPYPDAKRGLRKEMPTGVLEEEGEEEFVWRLGEFARRNLLSDEMKQRSLLKKAARGPVLTEVSWSVGLKTYDEVEGELPSIPVAYISLTYTSSRTGMSRFRMKSGELTFEIPVLVEPKQLDFELHRTEVKTLIDSLNRALEMLDSLHT